MPSTTIHARITAFEALARPTDILETPLSPIAAPPLQPTRPPSPSPSPSPPNLGRKTSLIDLKDWVVDDGPVTNGRSLIDASKTPTQPAFTASATAPRSPHLTGPLINFGSPPKPKPKPKPANFAAPFKAPPQLPPRKPSYNSLRSFSSSTSSQAPRSHADSLTVEAAHRYPPLTLDPERARNGGPSTHVSSSSVSSFHSVSLSEDTEPSTPGSVSNHIATFPMDAGHPSPPSRMRTSDSDTTSLTESYENVSVPSLASPATERSINLDWERATAQRRNAPPKLPERPNSARVTSIKSTPPPSHPVSRAASASGSGSIPSSPIIRPAVSAASTSSTFATPYAPAPYVPRRSAPPPPSRSSDRASIQSTTTTHSQSSSSQSHGSWANTANNSVRHSPSQLSLKTKRPTPVPSTVRRRYEALFVANVIQRRRAEREKQRKLTEAAEDGKPALLSPGEARGRRAVGWRGLSVDLITGDEIAGSSSSPSSPPSQQKKKNDDANIDEVVGPDERLEGALVRLIWQRSGLDKERLAEIWNECDLTGHGALSLEAFVKGMWRIDEELRRAQALALRAASSSSGASRRAGPGRSNLNIINLNRLNYSSPDSLTSSPISLHSPNQWPIPTKGAQQRGPPPPPPRPPQKVRDILR